MEDVIYTPPLESIDYYGYPLVAGTFRVGEQLYVMVFKEITSHADMRSKSYDINVPEFFFPPNGMVEIQFDAFSDLTGDNFGRFQHVEVKDTNPVALLRVVTLLTQHYTQRKPGGYLFYAAVSYLDAGRHTDLKLVYDRMLGFAQRKKNRPAKSILPDGWRAYNNLSTDGRGYAIIC